MKQLVYTITVSSKKDRKQIDMTTTNIHEFIDNINAVIESEDLTLLEVAARKEMVR